MPRLIVNADDFGASPEINQGIIQSASEGLVTSVSVMVNMPYAEDGLPELRRNAPHVGLGLHINLTRGCPVFPVAEVPTLVADDCAFYPETRLVEVAGSYAADELAAEINAQYERFVALIGQQPTHLDAHYHVAFLHPYALATVLRLADGRLPLRDTPLDAPPEDLERLLKRFLPFFPVDAARQLLPLLKAVVKEGPAAYMPARLEPGFTGEQASLGELLNILVALPDDRPTELLCHPASGNDDSHQRETEALIHPAAREVIEKFEIELISYADL